MLLIFYVGHTIWVPQFQIQILVLFSKLSVVVHFAKCEFSLSHFTLSLFSPPLSEGFIMFFCRWNLHMKVALVRLPVVPF